jgi:two-component system, OmpR family, osmolarity sensor histidine kinase EnvZ
MAGARAPRSLVWRLGALALVVSLLSLVLHLVVMLAAVTPIGQDMTGAIAARFRLMREMMLVTPADARDEQARRHSDARTTLRRQADTDQPMPADVPYFPRLFVDSMVSELGPEFDLLAVQRPTPEDGRRLLRVAFAADGERWVIEQQAQPPIAALLATSLGWLALVALAVGGSLFVGLRFIARPIEGVAEHFTAQGTALAPLAPPPRASLEVRQLVDAFNRLVQRVHDDERTRQQLLAGVSHDLRTPLARLRLRIETQCEAPVVEAAERELQAVEHIVSQFLAYVHGGQRSALPSGPTASVHALLLGLARDRNEQGQPVVLSWQGDDVELHALAFHRLVGNLVDNAVAHGRAPIELQWLGSGASWQLTVWDHGPGLSAEQFERARQPFVRLAQDSDIGHCGLGLAIADQIASQWGATLSCVRETGRFGVRVAGTSSATD